MKTTLSALLFLSLWLAATTALGQSASDSYTRPNNTTAYAANDVIADSTSSPTALEFELAGPTVTNADNPRRGVIISNVTLRVDSASLPSGASTFRLHFYDTAPTAINDNAAMNLPSGDRGKYRGYITLSTPTDLGDTLVSTNPSIRFLVDMTAGTTLYALLTTDAAYTPVAQTVYTVKLTWVNY